MIPIGLSFLWAASNGILGEYIEVAYVSLMGKGSHPHRLGDLRRCLGVFVSYLRTDGFALVALAIVGWCATRRASSNARAGALLLRAWAVLALLGLVGSGYFYPHQFKPLIVPVVLLGAVAAKRLETFEGRSQGHVWMVALAFVGLMFWQPLDSMLTSHLVPRKPWVEQCEPLVRHIWTHTEPQDTIFVVNNSSEQLYMLANRRAPSRVFNLVFIRAYGDEFQRDVKAHPRRLIIIGGGYTAKLGPAEEALGQVLRDRCRLARAFEGGRWLVYSLVPSGNRSAGQG